MDEKKKSKEESKEEMGRGIRAILRHLKPVKRDIIILSVLGLVSATANGFVPYITGRFFDALIHISKGETSFVADSIPLWAFLLGIWAIIQLVANNTDWIMDRLRRKVDLRVHSNIQTDGFKHLLRLPLQFHKNAHINGVLQKISSAGWRVSTIMRTVINITPQFLSIIIGITLAASINLTLAGILAVGVVIYVLLLIKILLPIAGIDSDAHRVWNESWDDAAASVHQIESVKQASTEEYESQKIEKSFLDRAYNTWMRLENSWSNVSFFQRIIVFLTQLTVFIMSVQYVSTGIISVGQLVALNGYSLMFFGPFVALGHSWQVIQNGITSAAHAEEIFNEKREEYVPKNVERPEAYTGSVVFNDVTFQYGADQPDVLSQVSFNVKAGESLAFVGQSGVGKSTVISLISAYYFPTEGSVLIDGVDTRKLPLKELRDHIAIVPQEVALFNDTIKENIRYGSFGASDSDIERVAKEAHIDEFVQGLPKGYETIVGERGVKLSVGQKQRVAIARAMLRKPAILILDEPTSALDSQTEKIITTSLEKLMQGRTTFIIAHRLSTVRKADRIFFFEKGGILEQGSHEELMQIPDGKYRQMYELHIGLH